MEQANGTSEKMVDHSSQPMVDQRLGLSQNSQPLVNHGAHKFGISQPSQPSRLLPSDLQGKTAPQGLGIRIHGVA